MKKESSRLFALVAELEEGLDSGLYCTIGLANKNCVDLVLARLGWPDTTRYKKLIRLGMQLVIEERAL